jgi:5-methylcytosine-specific restriction endonuclease McrA
MPNARRPADQAALDRMVAETRRARSEREASYRERALKLFPWVCGRCGRTFSGARLRELTVHHKDHNHDNNPTDGSNWELLCLYCHDNEHARQLDAAGRSDRGERGPGATHQPFAGLKGLLGKDEPGE